MVEIAQRLGSWFKDESDVFMVFENRKHEILFNFIFCLNSILF